MSDKKKNWNVTHADLGHYVLSAFLLDEYESYFTIEATPYT